MVEVFKTNVEGQEEADTLITRLHTSFHGYKANFDLDDCDHILRIQSPFNVDSFAVIHLLGDLGFHAEVLPDEEPPAGKNKHTSPLPQPAKVNYCGFWKVKSKMRQFCN